ncbi:MAG: ferredoxin family protein [Deltaproteobacteria bacterium]|jgi:2-oxoglutarate ferredoxin oxidoreductase subunit delta|nr:ferredoxin family protein [Deltaproteobacteria bacterium]
MSVSIDSQQCKGCMLCVEECPKSALTPGETRGSRGYLMPRANNGKCVSCGLCALLCPDLAISIIKEGAGT